MADISVSKYNGEQILAKYLKTRTPTRTPGYHVSDIIKSLVDMVPSLAKSLDMEEETRNGMFSLGLMWEDAYGHVTPWRSQAQMVLDDIVCTADYVDPLKGRVEECKLTWKSFAKHWDIREDFRWMTQAKSYCKVWNVRKAAFIIMFLNGDYKPPQPVCVEVEVEFSDLEVEENWQMMVRHRMYMEERDKDARVYSGNNDTDSRAPGGSRDPGPGDTRPAAPRSLAFDQ